MNYQDAQITVRDVNLVNAKIFNEGWMYVSQPPERALYFAPYFTNEVENPGISVICLVLGNEVVKLADKRGVGVNPPSNEHLSRWSNGLSLLRIRAQKEEFADREARIFYLDRPIEVWKRPITKKSFNESNPPKKIPYQIPIRFSIRFDDLQRYARQLG